MNMKYIVRIDVLSYDDDLEPEKIKLEKSHYQFECLSSDIYEKFVEAVCETLKHA